MVHEGCDITIPLSRRAAHSAHGGNESARARALIKNVRLVEKNQKKREDKKDKSSEEIKVAWGLSVIEDQTNANWFIRTNREQGPTTERIKRT